MSDEQMDPRFDGRQVLLPRVEMLRPGDILLTTDIESSGRKGVKQSAAIRKMTNGRFSHAMICSEPPVLVEAIEEGVSTLSLIRCFAHSRESIRVLRYPDEKVARRAAQLSQMEVGRDYSKARAVQTIFSSATYALINDHGTFCSALVAQAFLSAGAPEFERTAIDKTTPATIDDLSELIDVTDEIFRFGPAPNNADTMSALDGERVASLSAPQTAISKRYGMELLPLARRIVRKYPELGPVPGPTLNSMIEFVMDAQDTIEELGGQDWSGAQREVAILDEQLAARIASGELISLIRALMQQDRDAYAKMVKASFDPHPDIDVDALFGHLETTRSQLVTRRKGIAGMTAKSAGRSAAVRAYAEIENEVIAQMEAREPLLEAVLRRIA